MQILGAFRPYEPTGDFIIDTWIPKDDCAKAFRKFCS